MSFEFQSTLVNVTPSYRISGNQIGGVRIENNGGIEVARIIITNDADVKFALTGPYESGNPTTIYDTLKADLYEVATGVLLNEGAIGSVEIEAAKITIDLEGSDRKFTFMPDADVLAATEVADRYWKRANRVFRRISVRNSKSQLPVPVVGGIVTSVGQVRVDAVAPCTWRMSEDAAEVL